MKEGWATKTFEELIEDNIIGLTKNSREQGQDKAWPYVKMNNITPDNRFDLSNFTCVDATDEELRKFTLRNGDFLFNTRNSHELVGKSCIFKSDSDRAVLFNNNIMRVRFKGGVDARFVLLAFSSKSVSDELNALKSGTTNVSAIYFKDLRSLVIPVPSLPEQQRIVGILDKAFAGLAVAVANAEKNRQNARALFESHLQSVFTQRGEGWVEKKLEAVVDSDCSLSYGIVQPGDEFDQGMPLVRPTDLTTKVIHLSGLKRIDPKLASGYKRTALQGGELLLCVRGSTGVASIASSELVGANVTRGIVPIRFNRTLLLPEFGYYLITSGPVQSQIREKTYGAALMQINIRDVRIITLSIPSLKEQGTIAAKLDLLHEETQHLTAIYEKKLAALAELKKSLLHQAFSGEL